MFVIEAETPKRGKKSKQFSNEIGRESSLINIANIDAVVDMIRKVDKGTTLSILEAIKDEAKSVGTIQDEVGRAQAQISNYISPLKRFGLVNHVRKGKTVEYVANHERINKLNDLIKSLMEFDSEVTEEF